MRQVQLYDTTLRDGCQAEDINLTVEDKLRIAERLDDFGIHYIEGGWPGSNPRDAAFFQAVRALGLKQSRVAAFGSTHRPSNSAESDENLVMLLAAETPVVTVVGRAWDLAVRQDLKIPLERNLEIIGASVAFLRKERDEVIFDAEHFFDGYRANADFALACVRAAADAGASLICLCDTRGGSLGRWITEGVEATARVVSIPLGIHCHNDGELAVGNSIAAVLAGARQVQGTVNGLGERCGNANLCSVIPNLQLKLGYQCIGEDKLGRLRSLSQFVFELANQEQPKRQPYVGASAFAHKGGLHVAAVTKQREIYEHIDPVRVGNARRVLLSDLSGRSNVLCKAREFGIDLDPASPAVADLLAQLKELENQGFAFEAAEASFELLMHKALNGRQRYFRLKGFRVIDEKRRENEAPLSEATIMLEGPDGAIEHTAAEGNGPVNALDRALRKALLRFYPEIDEVKLLDYKVRVLGGFGGTAARVRVLIESGDEESRWGTVGVSNNVIEASWQALVDSLDYKLYKDREAGNSTRSGKKSETGERRPG